MQHFHITLKVVFRLFPKKNVVEKMVIPAGLPDFTSGFWNIIEYGYILSSVSGLQVLLQKMDTMLLTSSQVDDASSMCTLVAP